MKEERIYREIDPQELVDMASELIRIPSHLETPGQEQEIVRYLEERLLQMGFEVRAQEVAEGRKNLIATMKGKGTGSSLALNGHLDTVPPGNGMPDPYTPVVQNGRLYGRGACDMKGAVGAMLYAMVLLKRHGAALSGDLFFTGVVGEETGGTGSRRLVESGFRPDFAVVGEPTGLDLVVSHKGVANFEAIVHGKACHASIPEQGANAIEAACSFVEELERRLVPELKGRIQKHAGSATLSVGLIRGGTKINMVADRCSVHIDRRWVAGEEQARILSELEDLLREVCGRDERLRGEVKPLLPSGGYFGPFFIPEEHQLVSLAGEALGRAGLAPGIRGMQGWTDAATLMHAGVPALLLGPGSIEQAHTDDEYVEVDQLVNAVRAYLSLIETVCGRGMGT